MVLKTRRRFARDMAEIPDGVAVHVLPAGDVVTPTANLRYRDTKRVQVRAQQAYRALCRHVTQAGDPWYRLLAHQDKWRTVFARSQFVRVHPAPGPGDPVESSLVEGLDHD